MALFPLWGKNIDKRTGKWDSTKMKIPAITAGIQPYYNFVNLR